MVTRSGSSWCTFFSASLPSRAVPTTRNSSVLEGMSLFTRRMKALSSTTSTVCGRPRSRRLEGEGGLEEDIRLPHRRDHRAPLGHREAHRAPEVAPHRLAQDGDPRLAQRLARGAQVALAHVER